MKIKIITVGSRMPDWVTQGYNEYAKRLGPGIKLALHEIALQKRSNSDLKKILQQESDKILVAIPDSSHVIALDVLGSSWSSEQLSQQLANWQQLGQEIILLIGGPEGLSEACLQRANQKWSLSALTLPHPIVRIVLAETIYRAHTILQGHPYHK